MAARDITERLLAVDGNGLGHRAFHSVATSTDAGPRATTGAVVSMIASAWRHGPYDGVLVAFDHPVNRRREAFPEYKANRAPSDAKVTAAIRALRDDLAACGFGVTDHEGAEADDLLTAAADTCVADGVACDVLSSDRDLLALVTDGVRLLRPAATFADLQVEDTERVRATHGVEPWQYTELAALRGDPSDGLEGVPGIGAKTAARLIADHGSVTGVYSALSDLPPRIESALRSARDRVERNLLLMAPIPHLTVDISGSLRAGVDLERVRSAMRSIGEDAAARRFIRAVTDPPPPVPPPPSDPDEVQNAGAQSEEANVGRPRQHPAQQPPVSGDQSALF